MEEDLTSFIKVWVYGIISISYCYYIATRIRAGVSRLLSIFPVLVLFLVIPLSFSSAHLSFPSHCLLIQNLSSSPSIKVLQSHFLQLSADFSALLSSQSKPKKTLILKTIFLKGMSPLKLPSLVCYYICMATEIICLRLCFWLSILCNSTWRLTLLHHSSKLRLLSFLAVTSSHSPINHT